MMLKSKLRIRMHILQQKKSLDYIRNAQGFPTSTYTKKKEDNLSTKYLHLLHLHSQKFVHN